VQAISCYSEGKLGLEHGFVLPAAVLTMVPARSRVLQVVLIEPRLAQTWEREHIDLKSVRI
jgi:hypothetical protein